MPGRNNRLKEIDIIYDGTKVGIFHYRANDKKIVNRLRIAINNITKLMEKINDEADGVTPEHAENYIKRQADIILGYPGAGDEIFQKYSPLDLCLDGSPFFSYVFSLILDHIKTKG